LILLKAAQKIYRTYCEVNPNMVKRPTGVVINQLTYRGQLLFSSKPILLPQNVLYRSVKLNLKFLELSYELMKMLKGKVKGKG